MTETIESISSTLQRLLNDFGVMVAAAARKGVDLGEELVKGYVSRLLWLFKVCCTIWVVGVVCMAIGAWAGEAWFHAGGLMCLLFACVPLSLSASTRSQTWLMLAGRVSIIAIIVQVLLTLTGQHRAAIVVAYLTVGLPAVGFMIAVAPIATALDVVEKWFPVIYGELKLRVSIVIWGLLAVVINAIILLNLPDSPQPLFVGALAVSSIVLLLVVGVGLIKLDPQWLFSKWMVTAVVVLKGVGIIALMMPDATARVTHLATDLNDRFIDPPREATFESSKDIQFVDVKGRPILWFAERPDGGFDFRYTKSKGLHLPNGRALELADTDAERRKICEWVDQDAARRKAESEAAARREAEVIATRTAEEAQKQEKARIAADSAAAEKARKENDDRLAQATQARAEYLRHRDRARARIAAGELESAERAAAEADAVIVANVIVMGRDTVLLAQEEMETVRDEIRMARVAEQNKQADRLRLSRDKVLDDMIARSQGRLVELQVFENLSQVQISPSIPDTVLRDLLQSRCRATVIDPGQTPAAELNARHADVKVVSAKLLAASVQTSSPKVGDKTPLTVVRVTVLLGARSASSGDRTFSREKSESVTHLSSEVQGQSTATLVEHVVKKVLDDLGDDREFQAFFEKVPQ